LERAPEQLKTPGLVRVRGTASPSQLSGEKRRMNARPVVSDAGADPAGRVPSFPTWTASLAS